MLTAGGSESAFRAIIRYLFGENIMTEKKAGTAAGFDSDEMLKQMASQAVTQGENLRETVHNLTLQALKTRELTLEQIKGVLKAVTAGVNLGAATPSVDASKAFSEALRGMDQALLKAVQASHLALQQVVSQGKEFNESQMKKTLDDLERLEDQFLDSIKQASEGATSKVQEQWSELLKHTKHAGTDSGAQAMRTMEEFRNRMTATMRETRAATFKAAHAFSENFATLTSGILIGLSEALLDKGQQKDSK